MPKQKTRTNSLLMELFDSIGESTRRQEEYDKAVDALIEAVQTFLSHVSIVTDIGTWGGIITEAIAAVESAKAARSPHA
jgi:hypothetical protein